MADAWHHNPIVEALADDVLGRIEDFDAVQRHVDLVRAQIAENDALYAEAATQFARSRRRLKAAVAAASLALPEPKSEKEALELALKLDDPEAAARRAAYLEAAARLLEIHQHELHLFDALGFLVVARAFSFFVNRAHLLPRVLLTVAAAYALAYVASWGAVVPGPASVLRISVLLLCFLFGVPVVGNLA